MAPRSFLPVVLLAFVLVGCAAEQTSTVETPPEEIPQAVQENPLDIPPEGREFEPPVDVDLIPVDTWYCDMGETHYARGEEGDGRCPVCGMNLTRKTAEPAGEADAARDAGAES
jgi:hypothetical protein